LIAAALFGVLVLIAVYFRDWFVRPLGGDMLVLVFLYFLLRGLTPASRLQAGAAVLLFALWVELTQAAGLVEWLGLADHALACAVLGAVFDWKDVGACALGALCAVLLDRTDAQRPG
jgi:hypothetical protein